MKRTIRELDKNGYTWFTSCSYIRTFWHRRKIRRRGSVDFLGDVSFVDAACTFKCRTKRSGPSRSLYASSISQREGSLSRTFKLTERYSNRYSTAIARHVLQTSETDSLSAKQSPQYSSVFCNPRAKLGRGPPDTSGSSRD